MTYPLRRTYVDEIPGVTPGTLINNNELQALQKRLEDFSIYQNRNFILQSGYLTSSEITHPSVRRLTLYRNSTTPCRYIESNLGMWEIPTDLSIDFNQLTSGQAVDRYDQR